MYKRIAAIENDIDRLDVIDELIDRYGEPPAAVLGLITVALLRSLAKRAGIREISQKADSLLFYSDNLDMEIWGTAMDTFRGRIFINASANPYVAVKIPAGSDAVSVMQEVIGAVSG
jgi:transcription-repair coupling factor (superfamily II helicase)